MVLMPLIIPFGNLRPYCAEDEESGHHSLTHSLRVGRSSSSPSTRNSNCFPKKQEALPGENMRLTDGLGDDACSGGGIG